MVYWSGKQGELMRRTHCAKRVGVGLFVSFNAFMVLPVLVTSEWGGQKNIYQQ